MSHLNEIKTTAVETIISAGNDPDWTLIEMQRAQLFNSKGKPLGSGFKTAIVGKSGVIHLGRGLTPVKAVEHAQCMAKISEQGWG